MLDASKVSFYFKQFVMGTCLKNEFSKQRTQTKTIETIKKFLLLSKFDIKALSHFVFIVKLLLTQLTNLDNV